MGIPLSVRDLIDKILIGQYGIFSIWPYRLVRFVLAGIFIFAGAMKLSSPRAFAGLISQYGLVPDLFLVPIAIGLPLLEIMAGIGLMLDIRMSLSVITGLIIMFIFILWFGILKDLDIDCGCFSAGEIVEHDSLRTAMFRDFQFLGMAAYLYARRFVAGRKGL